MRPLLLALALICLPLQAMAQTVTVGSKKFTESVLLGEMMALVAEDAGFDTRHRAELGGTRVLFEALLIGDIDAYPEYTGTLLQEIFAEENFAGMAELRAHLKTLGIGALKPFGFNNTYGIGMRRAHVAELGIEKVSELENYPGLTYGFSNEFINRSDGWPALRETYNLPGDNVYGMDHDLAYRGLREGSIDVMEIFTTDAKIEAYDVAVLEDDRGLFPVYLPLVLYRLDLKARAPGAIEALSQLEGAIDENLMRQLNARADIERESARAVAADFLNDKLGIKTEISESGFLGRLWRNTLEHLFLVGISLSAAILVALPLGIAAYRLNRAGQIILGFTGILQTIPSLALFVFMIPLLGIGAAPAIAALFLYSLLPIVRNTHAGLSGIEAPVKESAEALGLPKSVILRRVELPLALRSILSGVKIAAVINVGTATLGALIGAGGYGQPILTGIRLSDTGLILEGAVPAAVLALLTQGVFELVERALLPRSLRHSS